MIPRHENSELHRVASPKSWSGRAKTAPLLPRVSGCQSGGFRARGTPARFNHVPERSVRAPFLLAPVSSAETGVPSRSAWPTGPWPSGSRPMTCPSTLALTPGSPFHAPGSREGAPSTSAARPPPRTRPSPPRAVWQGPGPRAIFPGVSVPNPRGPSASIILPAARSDTATRPPFTQVPQRPPGFRDADGPALFSEGGQGSGSI